MSLKQSGPNMRQPKVMGLVMNAERSLKIRRTIGEELFLNVMKMVSLISIQAGTRTHILSRSNVQFAIPHLHYGLTWSGISQGTMKLNPNFGATTKAVNLAISVVRTTYESTCIIYTEWIRR
jgi:hypothetical protein